MSFHSFMILFLELSVFVDFNIDFKEIESTSLKKAWLNLG